MIEELAENTIKYWESADKKLLAHRFETMISMREAPRSLIRPIESDDRLSFIMEIKRKSPSAGNLNPEMNSIETARLYEKYGATAVSVLTDHTHFGGSLEDLKTVSGSVSIPVLRKDFIVDEMQIPESRAYGADAVLLIVRLLGKKTSQFLKLCTDYGMDALVEVHNSEELAIALESEAKIIGINNRNLDTLEINLNTTATLFPDIPPGHLVISESGMSSAKAIDAMRVLGVDGVLIGSAFSTAESIEEKLKELTACLQK